MSKKVRRQAIGVALFPFLAVLICTMGALIVLLVLLVQQARLDAREVVKDRQQQRAPEDPLAAERKVAQEKIEDETWRKGILEGQRAERLEELANARLKVDHLEDHIRRLQDQARTMLARAREIDEGRASKSPDLTAEQNELARLQAEIAKKKTELDQKKKELAKKDRSYALIPYDGPNGTKRRPIYIECTQRGVILQPEGVVLGPEDFSGPLNPGNPLDAALRAVRDTWRRSGEPGEPYPLLVVRPDGVVAYSAAREALRGWDEEFGYELVDDEKQLDFGGPNPALKEQLIQIVGVARQRQVMLAAAMPRKFGADAELTSFAPQDQPSFQSAIAAARGSGGVANGNGEFSGGSGAGTGGVGGTGIGGAGSYPARSVALGGTGAGGYPGAAQFASNTIQASRAGQGSGLGGSGTGQGGTGNSPTGASSAGNATSGNRAPSGAGTYGTAQAAGTSPAGGSGQAGSGQPGSGQSGTAPGTSVQYGSARPGSMNGAAPSANAADGSSSATGQTTSGSTASSGSPGSGASSPSSDDRNARVSASLDAQRKQVAAARANNWGLPDSKGRTTAVTRPIRVVCLPDKLVVVPDRGVDRPPTSILISPELQPEEVEAFVKAVQKHLDAWGPAMLNGYWKPVLQVEVTRAADPQFQTLELLLRGSGFEIQRKAL